MTLKEFLSKYNFPADIVNIFELFSDRMLPFNGNEDFYLEWAETTDKLRKLRGAKHE